MSALQWFCRSSAKNIFISFPIILLSVFYSFAQEADSSFITLKRVFSDKEFEVKKIDKTQWLEDGDYFTKLEPSGGFENSQDIVSYQTESGKREVLVAAEELVAGNEDLPLDIDGYSFSTDNSKVLIFTNAEYVWRYKTRGDYYVLDRTSKILQKLGGKAKPSTLMFATFSPDGNRVAYVRENNLYVEDLKSKTITALTTNGSNTIINGTFDWVYEEELKLRNGFRWSPDGSQIAYWQLDAEGVGEFYMMNNIDSIYSQIIPVQYPKVGTTNSAARAGVVSSSGGETTWFDIPGDPRNHYIARMEWAESSKEVIIQQLNRLQNRNHVMLGNAEKGEVTIIYTDRDSAWLHVVDDLHWLNKGKAFTWISERDGWKHVYRVSRTGDVVRLLTPGNYDVINLLGVDEEEGKLYFIASPDDPTRRYLYSSNLDGSGKPKKLSPKDQPGIHTYKISPNTKWAFHTYSTLDNPPVTELIQLPEHDKIMTIQDNSELRDKLAKLNINPAEFFRLEIEPGTLLDGYMIKPFNFDPSKKYPVLFYVYGEPAGQTVLDRYRGRYYLWHQMLAQQGYIIISIDNRGTPAPRGRAWRKSVYRQIGILASADQAAALRKIRQWDFIDSTRVAIWGWSGGGSMSLNCIFRYPKLYHTAMAVAFVANELLYDTIYQERYMGLPEDNADGYKYGSPVTFAHQLEGNLLLMHGTNDDNVHYQNVEVLVNELIKHNKMFTLVPYPNRRHSIREPEHSRRHVFETLTWYLKNHVPPGPVN